MWVTVAVMHCRAAMSTLLQRIPANSNTTSRAARCANLCRMLQHREQRCFTVTGPQNGLTRDVWECRFGMSTVAAKTSCSSAHGSHSTSLTASTCGQLSSSEAGVQVELVGGQQLSHCGIQQGLQPYTSKSSSPDQRLGPLQPSHRCCNERHSRPKCMEVAQRSLRSALQQLLPPAAPAAATKPSNQYRLVRTGPVIRCCP